MMEQWTLFPTVLQRKFLLTLLAGIASAGISIIICVATKDQALQGISEPGLHVPPPRHLRQYRAD